VPECKTVPPKSGDIARSNSLLSINSGSELCDTLLDGSLTVFDYGCGRGDDVRALQSLGLNSTVGSPLRPDNEKTEADVVNLGFVLNVIEDQRERLEALRGAWSLTKRLLSVSVSSAAEPRFERFRCSAMESLLRVGPSEVFQPDRVPQLP